MSKTKLKAPNPPSVLIAVPCMSHVPVEFMSSFAALDVTPNGAITMESGSLVYKARNNLAEKAIRGEFDYMMWIDSDMVFGPDLVSRMLEEAEEKQLDYLTALAFTRGFPVKPILYETVDWEPKEGGGVITGAHTYYDYPRDQLFKIEASGLGACLMKTSLLVDVAKEFRCAPFNPLQGLGEDMSLCWRLKKMGVDMWCDSRIKVGHIGWLVFDEKLYRGRIRGDVR